MHLMAIGQKHGNQCGADIASTASQNYAHAVSLGQRNSACEYLAQAAGQMLELIRAKGVGLPYKEASVVDGISDR